MDQILLNKGILFEGNRRREIVRTIVKDIINIIKNDGDGEYYLPMDLTDQEFYKFNNFPHDLVVELQVTENEDIDDYFLNGEIYREDNLMVIMVEYNPENKNKLLYDMIGELNEIVAHEIRHFDQYSKGMFDFSDEEEEEINEPEVKNIIV
jgi:hypothetical protein